MCDFRRHTSPPILRIAVIGAGLAGITTAYELTLAGHQVTVYEQRASAASEGSFAGSGLRGLGFTLLSHPATAMESLSIVPPTPLQSRLLGVVGRPRSWGWIAGRWGRHRRIECNARDDGLQSLHARGEQRVLELQSRLQWDLQSSRGLLLLLAKPADERRIQPLIRRFERLGGPWQRWPASEARTHEPGLNPSTVLHGALSLPTDSTTNGRLFTQLLRQEAERQGVRFAFGTKVRSIEPGTQPEVLIQAFSETGDMPNDSQGPRRERHDAVVVCAAMGTLDLLPPAKLRLPLLGLRSVAVTAPLRLSDSDIDNAPSSGVLDVARMVSITRLGREVRATRLPFVGSGSKAETERTVKQLFSAIQSWFPSAATVRQARPWSGTVATLPDGLPAVGPSGIDGVWLNVGAGQGGWSLACGHALLLSDLMGGQADLAHAAAVAPQRWERR